jgi:hypothetical protein
MKFLLTAILLLVYAGMLAQTRHQATNQSAVELAATYMNGSNGYKPQQAFALYTQSAREGNAKAMNALGIHYSKGLGVTADVSKAFEWFEKAAQQGYTNAWINLGNLYQRGAGAAINFQQAYQCYQKAALAGNKEGAYKAAYLLYKGLGVTQDYTRAYKLFYASSAAGYSPAMYFLGLCYRNGYGVARNADSARYWLTRAAVKGSEQAKQELAMASPENPVQPIALPAAIASPAIQALQSSKYQRVKHNVQERDLPGKYTGYAVKYDWSGQHIVSVSSLAVTIGASGSVITGSWKEDDAVTATVNAVLTPSSLVFHNTQYGRTHHYSAGKPETFEFKEAALQLVQQDDGILLYGNLQLYSPSRQEPGKPYYAVLKKASPAGKLEAITISDLQTYPNPFTSALTVSFTLNRESTVSLAIYTIDGKRLSGDAPALLLPGSYKRTLSVNQPAGTYLVQLECNGETRSVKISKQ